MAVLIIRVVEEGGGGAERDPADLVQGEITGIFLFPEGVDVDLVADLLDDRFRFPSSVADDKFTARVEIGGGEPADHGFDILSFAGWVVLLYEHVASGHVDLILEGDGD